LRRTETHIEVEAKEVKQGDWTIYVFVVPSDAFDRIAFVSRRDDDKEAGYQRNLSKQRAAEIAQYLDKEKGCIPNSILVNLEDGARFDRKKGLLRIPNTPRAAWVIDGQHRMFGLRQAKTKFDLVVTAFLGLDVPTQAKQFKIINSKQRGVSTSLLYDLLDLTKDGSFVQQRGHDLAARLNDDSESPWFGEIDMTGSGSGLITQTRVVSALEGLISERGALYPYSEEEQFGILKNYFTAVKMHFPSDWANKKSVLTKAMGFSALLIILPQILMQTLQRYSDFTVKSAAKVLEPLKTYNFSADEHKGWAGHPGENRLAAALAERLKSAAPEDGAGARRLRLS